MAFKDWYENPKYEAGTGKSYWGSWSKWSYLDDPLDDVDKKDGALKKDKDSNKRACEDALRSVSRSANVILNSGSQERSLTVKFSNGENVNTLKDDTIYLSPDALLACVTRDEKEDTIDSMSGQAMLSAQLKRQLDPNTYQEFLASKDREIRSLWSSIELAIARGEVIGDWAGFKPYFDMYAKTSSKVTSTVIKRELSKHNGTSEDKPTSAKAFVMGVAWNLYHSHDPIRIPPAYNDGKMLVAAGLRGAESCKERWNFCSLVVAELRRMYDTAPPPGKGPGAPEGSRPLDFEESAEGVDMLEMIKKLEKIRKEEDPATPKKSVPKRGADKFTGVDEELFGVDKIANKKCKEAGDIDAISGDSTSELKDSVSAPSIPGPGGYRGRTVKRGIPFWLPKDKPSRESKKHFDKSKIAELNRVAEVIKDSFGFTDKLAKRKIYGLKSGVIRPEALYRLELGSDEVFYKTTLVDVDKVSVCLLIDQSGSMGSHSHGSAAEKVVEAAEVAYVLAHLCKDLKHMDLSVIGFSAQESCDEARLKLTSGSDADGEVDMRLIYDSMDPSNSNIEDICHIRSHSNNLDGFSLWYAAKHMSETRADRKRKVLIVVSDGSPNGRGYGGDEAEAHVALCKKDVKARFGIDTYAIGISNAYTQDEGDKMYGAGNNIIIGDVKSSVGFLSRFLNQVSQIA